MRYALLLSAGLLAGCINTVPLPRVNPDVPSPALERKVVSGKREPLLLIASDGSSCPTTERRYQRARPGDRVWCVWTR
jgi:hypothetical protein